MMFSTRPVHLNNTAAISNILVCRCLYWCYPKNTVFSFKKKMKEGGEGVQVFRARRHIYLASEVVMEVDVLLSRF